LESPAEAIETIKLLSRATELYHVSTFVGYRENDRGQTKRLTIVVWDAGPLKPDTRYRVLARDDEGHEALGKAHERLDEALAIVQWSDLDR